MKHSYLLAGITSGDFRQMLARNGFSAHPRKLPRLLFLTQNALWASALKAREKRKFGRAVSSFCPPADPVFIIGHWRTGSTLLHQLMSLDDKLVSPNVLQVSVPDSFLVSEKYYAAVMSKVMGSTRPMDNVKLGVYEPQEDEYALLKLSAGSPLEKLIFPENNNYFLVDYTDFIPATENLANWKNSLNTFCKKLSLINNRQVLLKNPFHSMRIPLLREMYPGARFIHIHRHPYEVVPSTIHMWDVVGRQNVLKGKAVKPKAEEVATVLNRMLDYVDRHWKDIPGNRRTEIAFSELEKNPAESLKKIYNDLEMEAAPTFWEKVNQWIEGIAGYRKNAYQLTEVDKETIRKLTKKHFDKYDYKN